MGGGCRGEWRACTVADLITCAQPLAHPPLLVLRPPPAAVVISATHPPPIAVMEKNGIEQLLRAEDEAAAIVQKARESTNQRAGHREAGAWWRQSDGRTSGGARGDWRVATHAHVARPLHAAMATATLGQQCSCAVGARG